MRALLTCLFVFGIGLGLTTTAHAHNPYAMSVRLHETHAGDFVEVIAPTAKVQSAIDRRYADAPHVAIDSKAGKERFIRYLEATLELSTPEGPLKLGAGGIRVDGQQVVVRLRVVRPTGAEYPLAVHAPCLAENHGQIVTFRVMGEHTGHVVLQENTEYRATLELDEHGELAVQGQTGHAEDDHAHHDHDHG